MRPFLLASAVALAVSCGPVRPPCSQATCDGCCDVSGMCQFGSSNQACGSRGEACKQCPVAEICSFGTCVTNVGGTGGSGGAGGGAAGGAGGSGGGSAGGSSGGSAGGSSGGSAGGSSGGSAGGSSGGSAGGSGGGVALPGETCASAEPLTLTSGAASVTATTTGYANDHSSPTCASAGPDRFYRFTLATTSNLVATLSPSSNSFGSLALLGPSSSCASATESTCVAGTTPGGMTTLNGNGLAPGSYVLVVKNLGTGDGAFNVAVSTTTVNLPGDTCISPVPLTFSAGTASASGTTTGAANDRGNTSCTGLTGADVVYSFTATPGQVFSATVTPTSPMAAWRPVLSLSGPGLCASAPEATCNAATSAGGTATLTSMPLTAGPYFLWVDSASGAGTGTFTLSASLSAGTPGESCSSPIPLTFSNGVSTVMGSLSGSSSEHVTTLCSSTSTSFAGPDLVYSFTATGAQTFWAQLFGTGFRGALSLRGPNASCSSAAELDCASATPIGTSPASLTSRVLPAGTYYLHVDSPASSNGPFTLNTTLTTGPTGENCASAIPLSFVGGTASVVSSNATANPMSDRRSVTCGGDGPDRVYSFAVSGTRSLIATLQGTSQPTILALTGPSTTCSTAPELTCLGGSGPSGSTISRTVTTGTYYLWVDTFGTTPSGFSLSVTLN
ncbi:MAG: hypothetical protein SFW67_23845 [Myxococcaceae bacterium]|nr:hypothetical protein [Myxococcaceae bacterium]